MPRVVLKVDADEVMRNLRAMDREEARNLTKWERDAMRPVFRDWTPLIPRGKTGNMAASARIGVKRGHVWMGYGDGAPVYMGLQEFGGSVPAPHSRNAAARLGALAGRGQANLSQRAIRTGERRILVKPRAPSESWTLYPTWRRHEFQLADAFDEHLMELKTRYGF